MSLVWRVFAHKSTKSRRITKIGRKVVRDILNQLQNQKVKRQGHQAA